MPEQIVIKRPVLYTILLLVVGGGLFLLARTVPDIRREIKIWTM